MNFKFFFKITLIFKQFHSSKFFRKLKISSAINSKRVRRNQFLLNWYWALQTDSISILTQRKHLFFFNHQTQQPETHNQSTNPKTHNNEINKPKHLINAAIAARTRNSESDSAGLGGIVFGTAWWFLVLFAGARSVGLGGLRFQWRRRSSDIAAWKQICVGWGWGWGDFGEEC